jgi:hypothetical protein
VIRGELGDGKPPLVKRVVSTGEGRGQCQILFITKEQDRTAAILAALKDESILAAGECEKFIHLGGTTNFLFERNRVRLTSVCRRRAGRT